MKLSMELNVPNGAVDYASEAELVRSFKEQAVLRIYAEDRVTVGEAAGMLGCTRIDFLQFLTTSGVGFQVDLDAEDFEQVRKMRDAARAR